MKALFEHQRTLIALERQESGGFYVVLNQDQFFNFLWQGLQKICRSSC